MSLFTVSSMSSARAGHAGIYSEGNVQYIASELRRIDEERGVADAE